MITDHSPTRSFGTSSLIVELDLEKLRLNAGSNTFLGVGETTSPICASDTFTPSEFQRRCLFATSVFPSAT